MLLDNSEIKWAPSSLLRQHCLNRLEHKKKHNNENSNSPKKGKTKREEESKRRERTLNKNNFIPFFQSAHLPELSCSTICCCKLVVFLRVAATPAILSGSSSEK